MFNLTTVFVVVTLLYFTKNDTFYFAFNHKIKSCPNSGQIFSIANSVYKPLGFLAFYNATTRTLF